MREEQLRLRPNLSRRIDGEVLGEMAYTRQVVKEMLRFRAPAPMVPQVGGVVCACPRRSPCVSWACVVEVEVGGGAAVVGGCPAGAAAASLLWPPLP